MKTVEVLYDTNFAKAFLDPDEFSVFREQWLKTGRDPLLFIYPDRTEIWLLPV